MNVKSLFILLLTTVLTFSTLYTPQPILPLLAQEFSVSGSEISLLISLTLFPLGLMPIIYGYLIDNVSARTILHWFIGMLAVTELSLAFVSDFRIMLVFRLLQGLLLPAIFTAIVTYISNHSSADQRQKSISSYIAATIIWRICRKVSHRFNFRHLRLESRFYGLDCGIICRMDPTLAVKKRYTSSEFTFTNRWSLGNVQTPTTF